MQFTGGSLILNDYLLINIISYIPTRDRVKLERVNTRLRDLLLEVTTEFLINYDLKSTESALNWSSSPNSDTQQVRPESKSILKYYNLRKIDARLLLFHNRDQFFADLGVNCKRIQVLLNYESCLLKEDIVSDYFRKLKNKSSLTTLSVKVVKDLSYFGNLKPRNLPKLTALKLVFDDDYGPDDMGSVNCRALRLIGKQIKELTVDAWPGFDVDHYFPNLTKLKILHFGDDPLQTQFMKKLVQAEDRFVGSIEVLFDKNKDDIIISKRYRIETNYQSMKKGLLKLLHQDSKLISIKFDCHLIGLKFFIIMETLKRANCLKSLHLHSVRYPNDWLTNLLMESPILSNLRELVYTCTGIFQFELELLLNCCFKLNHLTFISHDLKLYSEVSRSALEAKLLAYGRKYPKRRIYVRCGIYKYEDYCVAPLRHLLDSNIQLENVSLTYTSPIQLQSSGNY